MKWNCSRNSMLHTFTNHNGICNTRSVWETNGFEWIGSDPSQKACPPRAPYVANNVLHAFTNLKVIYNTCSLCMGNQWFQVDWILFRKQVLQEHLACKGICNKRSAWWETIHSVEKLSWLNEHSCPLPCSCPPLNLQRARYRTKPFTQNLVCTNILYQNLAPSTTKPNRGHIFPYCTFKPCSCPPQKPIEWGKDSKQYRMP